MLDKVIFAGFGGQGVLVMGLCLATAGMNEDKHVTYLPSYGAEVRGGTANCTISISDEEIASPIASSPDCIVIMNEPSLARFQNMVKIGGFCITNSTLVASRLPRKDVTEIRVPAGKLAESVGSIRTTNMVMLGALVAASELVSLKSMIESVEQITAKKRKELAALNGKAIEAGYEYAKKELQKNGSKNGSKSGIKNGSKEVTKKRKKTA